MITLASSVATCLVNWFKNMYPDSVVNVDNRHDLKFTISVQQSDVIKLVVELDSKSNVSDLGVTTYVACKKNVNFTKMKPSVKNVVIPKGTDDNAIMDCIFKMINYEIKYINNPFKKIVGLMSC